MARRNSAKNNSRKKKVDPWKIKPGKIFTRKLLWPALIAAFLFASVFFLGKSSYFSLDNVTIIGSDNAVPLGEAEILRTYKGRNIFGIDIQALAFGIKKDYPVTENVIVKRVMPDSLEIHIIPRVPVAKVKAREYFPVDKTGMVLSPKMEGTGKLPVIVGFSVWTRLEVGERLKGAQLESAFRLIDALKESSVMSNYDITVIDVANYNNVYFYLDNGIEVRIGEGDYVGRLKKLKATLANPELDKDHIKYFDLRFKGVVIGPK